MRRTIQSFSRRATALSGGTLTPKNALLVSLVPTLACAGSLAIAAAPVVAPHPFIVHLGQPATVSVTGISVASLEVRLAGATTAKGVLLPWRAMVRAGGGEWQAVLPRPALRGVYEIQLRAGPTSPVLSSQNWLLRVLDPGTLEHPAFATPEAVARWWVRTVPAQMRLVALRRWTRPGFDRRDPRLHQLMVVAYRPAGDKRVSDRLGMFIMAFRNGYGGRWRLLEATVSP